MWISKGIFTSRSGFIDLYVWMFAPQTSKNCDMERSNWANLGDSDFMFQGFIEVFMNSHSISIRCGLDWLDMTLDRDIHWISIRYH